LRLHSVFTRRTGKIMFYEGKKKMKIASGPEGPGDGVGYGCFGILDAHLEDFRLLGKAFRLRASTQSMGPCIT